MRSKLLILLAKYLAMSATYRFRAQRVDTSGFAHSVIANDCQHFCGFAGVSRAFRVPAHRLVTDSFGFPERNSAALW
jgi:hypothetical protein